MRRKKSNLEPASDRRADQRARLVEAADAAIASGGLTALRARDLATSIGCSLGAIYNLVGDLDELVLLVSERTMVALGAHLDRARPDADDATAQLTTLALAYADFAATDSNRWRALFEFRMQPGATLPAWFAAAQEAIFVRLETCLGRISDENPPSLRLRARTLFSAVHGIVWLGLDGKLVAMPAAAIEAELTRFISTYVAGLDRSR